jgi:hypothetical protein
MIKVSVVGNLTEELARATKKAKARALDEMLLELKKATPVDTGAARDAWRIEGNSIVNDQDYIDKLNSGSSTQAPKHFIEQAVLRVAGVIPHGSIVRTK